jgi:hypothetical protein
VAKSPQVSACSCPSSNFHNRARTLARAEGNSLDNRQHSSVTLPTSCNRLFEAFDIAWPTLTRIIADHGLTDDTARRKLADAVLLFVEDNRSAAEIAEAALEKLGV